jgi:hypothetical protein
MEHLQIYLPVFVDSDAGYFLHARDLAVKKTEVEDESIDHLRGSFDL